VAHDLQREIRLAGVGPSQIDLEEQGESREQREFKENKENKENTENKENPKSWEIFFSSLPTMHGKSTLGRRKAQELTTMQYIKQVNNPTITLAVTASGINTMMPFRINFRLNSTISYHHWFSW